MRLSLIAIALGAAACSHNDLLQPQPPSGGPPRGSGVFHRVNLNPADDRFPSWLPGDSTLVYSLDASEVPGADRCIATIPAEGGTRRDLPCLRHRAPDSAAHSDWPAARGDGRIAYVWEPVEPFPTAGAPDSAVVFFDTTAVFTFPYIEPGVRFFHTVSHLSWLKGDTLVGVGITATVVQDCGSCPFRPVRIGRDVILLDLRAGPATLIVVPGTSNATAVAPGPTGDDVYFTVAGDSRVMHRILASGASNVVHDFGAAGIARDVRVANGRLVAVVGGTIAYRVDLVGPIQDDSGGPLHLLTLATSTDSILPDSGALYRYPALNAAGNRVVAEGWRNARADIWYYRLP